MAQSRIDLREQTKSFALRVVRMFSSLPKTTEAQVLGKQVLRSGTSTGANSGSVPRSKQSGIYCQVTIIKRSKQ